MVFRGLPGGGLRNSRFMMYGDSCLDATYRVYVPLSRNSVFCSFHNAKVVAKTLCFSSAVRDRSRISTSRAT